MQHSQSSASPINMIYYFHCLHEMLPPFYVVNWHKPTCYNLELVSPVDPNPASIGIGISKSQKMPWIRIRSWIRDWNHNTWHCDKIPFHVRKIVKMCSLIRIITILGSGFRFTSSYIFPMYGTVYIYKGLDAHSNHHYFERVALCSWIITAWASGNPHRRSTFSNPRSGFPAAGRLRPRVPQQQRGHFGRVRQSHDHLLPRRRRHNGQRRGRQESLSRPAVHGHAVQRTVARLGPARRHRRTGTTLALVCKNGNCIQWNS